MVATIASADDHLDRLLLPESLDAPWYRDFAQNFRDAVRSPSLPLLELTSRPVEPKKIWGLYGRQKKSWLMSLAFQSLAVAMIFGLASSPEVRKAAQTAFDIYVPVDLTPPKTKTVEGGGGGGDRSALPAAKGKLPKPSLKQFTPPVEIANNNDPKLTMDPSILAPPDLALPQVAMNNYGDPLGKLGPLSNGPGSGSGIGSGKDGGVGVGNGPGVGPGSNGGMFGDVYVGGHGVSSPVCVYKVEPEYSEEARKAKYQGTVVLQVVVDAAGHVVNPRVIHSLGLGLDEKAVEAVMKWKFKPGYKNGKAVSVFAQVEVSFRLL